MSNGNTHGNVDAAMQVICPQHPNRSGKLVLRSGVDKRGNFVFFQSSHLYAPPDAWSIYRDNDRDSATVRKLHSSGQIDDHRGPAMTTLHFHISERNVVST